MADIRLLQLASDAERLAQFCRTVEAELKALDILIEAEIGRFSASHRGETPDQLHANYQQWKDRIMESLPFLDNAIHKSQSQAQLWRADYERQQSEEAKA